MYRILCRNTVYICGAVVIPQVTEDLTNTNQSESFNVKFNRVKQVFCADDYGEMSPQFGTILQSTFCTGLFGCVYGGFIGSKEAYLRFIERNEATKFIDHFEAKRKLQNTVTMAFGKGALRWGWRLAFFGGSYISLIVILEAFRGSSSVVDYSLAGLFSGIVYRFHMGVKAMVASGTLGAMMGLFAGCLTSLMFRLTGSTLDDIHHYSHEIASIRERHFQEAVRKGRDDESRDMLMAHEVIANRNREPSNPV